MSLWKSLLDRAKDKKDELQRKAVKKAARGALDSAGRAIEKALFGDAPSSSGEEEAEPPPPDPFAKLKAAEADTKARAAAQKKLDREVDAELAALKERLRK